MPDKDTLANLELDTIKNGDCREILPSIESNSIALIITSPPYSDQRKSTYGGIPADDYVKWFQPIGKELYRVLKPSGSFVLNIKERVVDGERHTYVIKLILALRKLGWRWVEEYCWHKKNSTPGKWPNRFRDGWERCLHFAKTKDFKMRQNAVMVPTGEWKNRRLRNLSETDMIRDNSRSGSGFGKRIANWIERDYAYPDNVLHMSTVCHNKAHPAAFPEALPEWFIKLFTDKGDVVLDPFVGSGTTAVAAKRAERHYIGIDMVSDYCALAEAAVANLHRKSKKTLFVHEEGLQLQSNTLHKGSSPSRLILRHRD